MGKKGIKGRTLMFAAEVISPVMMLSLLLPSLYLVLPERSYGDLYALYRGGFLLLPFVILMRGVLWKLKGYSQFLLLGVLSMASVVGFARIIGNGFGKQNLATAFVIVEALEILLVLIDTDLIRRREIDRRRAELENDITWVRRKTIFDYPRYLHLVWFAVLYVNGLLLDAAKMCDIVFVNTALYFLMTAAYTRARKTEEYLRQMNYISHIPVRRMKRIGTGVGILFLAISMLLMVPAFLTSGLRQYTDLRELSFSGELTEEEWEQYFASEQDSMLLPGEFQPEAAGKPSVVLEYAVYAAAVVIMLWLTWFMIKVLRGYFDEFRDRYDDNGDLAVSLTDEDDIEKVRPERRYRRPRTEPERIRAEYKKVIRTHRKDRPTPPEMPVEIEEKAGLAGTQEGSELHARYEHARYGKWE